MATAPVAPAAAPAPATPAPAAAPSTPVVSTPTPAPAPAAPDNTLGGSDGIEERLGAAWNAVKDQPIDDGTGEPTEPAKVEEPAATPAEPAAVAEPEAKPEVADAKPEFELNLEDIEAASPETLFKELKNDPAAEKFFNDRPELKNKVFAALRRDTENRELRKIVPDIETAKEMSRGATLYSDFDTHFLQATTPEGYKGFIDKWVEEAVMLGDDGKPLTNADGTYQLHPSLPFIMNQIHENQAAYALSEFKKTGSLTPQMSATATAIAEHFLQKAKVSGDERLEAAAEIFKEAVTPSSSATEEIPEHLKSLQDSLTAKEKALKDQEQAAERQRQESESNAAKAARQQAIDHAETKAADSVKGQLKPLFAKSGLTEFETTGALREIGEKVDELMAKDDYYQADRRSAEATLTGEALEKRLFRLQMTWANVHIGDIAANVIRAAKGGALNRQTERQTTVDSQKKASTADPRGTSITASGPAGGRITNAQLEKEYMDSHNGERPDQEWVLGEALKRNAGGARRA